MIGINNHVGSKANRRAAVLVATMGAFFTPFMGSSVNIALPTIGKEFALDAVVLGWIPTAYLLAAATLLVPAGRLADIFGRKRIFKYGVIIYTVSCLLLGLSTSVAMLISFRVLQGIAAAMVFSTGVAILTSVFPVAERGKVLGLNIASVYLGLSLGPTLGGLLTQYLGWRSIFLTNVPLGLATIIATLKLEGEWAEAKGEKFDLAGSIVYGVALASIMYGFSILTTGWGPGLIMLGISGIFAFIWWERRLQCPVLNIRLFSHNTVFSLSNLAALINYSATFAVGFLLSLYLQYIKGFSPAHAGMILVAMPAVQAIFSPFAGRLSDRIEPRILASTGMALTTCGLALMIFLKQETALGLIVANLMLLGLGMALFSSPNTNAIMSSVEKRFYGVASGMLGTMRLTGQMLSLGIAMLLLALYIGAQITPEYFLAFLQSVRTAFIIFAALCFVGIFASFARGSVRQRQ